MIYSEKVKEWVEKNRPEDVVISVEQVITVAERCGLQAKASGTEEEKIALRKEEGKFYAEETITLEKDDSIIVITWRNKVNKEEGEIVYFPYISHGGSYHGLTGVDDSPIQKTFIAFGLKERPVKMPEPVVQLPVPSWVNLEMLEQDWPNADIASMLLFDSEAKKMVRKFREKLEEDE